MRRRQRVDWIRRAFVTLGIFAMLAAPSLGHAQERWSAGLDAGLWSGTVNGTVLAIAGTADYYPVKVFSVGGLALVAPGSDLRQFALAGVARYHYLTRWGEIAPFAGLGFIHASVSAGSLSRRGDSNTSHYIPLGLTVQYQLTRKLALATTGILNLHAINLQQVTPGGDEVSFSLLFGVRFGP